MEDFKEEPIVTEVAPLRNLVDAIRAKGFGFHPGRVLEKLNAEVEAQFDKLCKEHLTGLSIGMLEKIQGEVYEWMRKEDARFEEHKRQAELMATPPSELEQVAAPIESITEKRKGKKGK